MTALPILLIQLRRLGDLIMTFPLLYSLRMRYPANPIFFVGEESFYKELQPFVPGVKFFPAGRLGALSHEFFEMIINLDSRPEAALCTASAKANLKIGPQSLANGSQHIEGFWQLYRASLTQNNRHNLFHWGDLNRLDLEYPLSPLPSTTPKSKTANGRIGLFVGASEASKRPENEFWTVLARLLLARGFKPVFLGGPAEKEAGEKIAAKAGLKNANFCGKTSLGQLASLLKSLDLLITPDTGPMHLADCLGISVFNLSMGNVHAAETGPIHPGHLLMRSGISCAACWQCDRGRLLCRNSFNPALVARIAHAYIKDELSSLDSSIIPAELLLSSRDENGLYKLSPVFSTSRHTARDALDRFWQTAFLFFNSRQSYTQLQQKVKNLAHISPVLVKNMHKNTMKLLSLLVACARAKKDLPPNLWQSFPRNLSLFAGFIEMSLQNDSFSRTALSQALELTAHIGELFALSA